MSIYNLAHAEATSKNDELEAFRKFIVLENRRIVEQKLNFYGLTTFEKSLKDKGKNIF